MPVKTIIMGAAGRDFHNFNTFFRGNKDYEVVAFTATQIPDIEGRVFPAELAGALYPKGIPIRAEEELADLIRKHQAEQAGVRESRLRLVAAARQTLANALRLLDIQAPEVM